MNTKDMTEHGRMTIGKFEFKLVQHVDSLEYAVVISWNAEGAHKGNNQFVAKYNVETILETPNRKNLQLDTNIPEWTLDEEQCTELYQFTKQKMEFRNRLDNGYTMTEALEEFGCFPGEYYDVHLEIGDKSINGWAYNIDPVTWQRLKELDDAYLNIQQVYHDLVSTVYPIIYTDKNECIELAYQATKNIFAAIKEAAAELVDFNYEAALDEAYECERLRQKEDEEPEEDVDRYYEDWKINQIWEKEKK